MWYPAKRYWSVSFLLLLLLPSSIRSQAAGEITRVDLGGRNTVAGIVFAPSGTPVGRGIRIRLLKAGAGADASTDEQGRFRISGLAAGSYTLQIEAGDEYETETHRVEIEAPRGGLPTTEWLQVQLRFKASIKAKPGVIDAEMAAVPKRAAKHYQNARVAAAKNDSKTAIEELRRAIAAYPDFFNAHADLGIQYQKVNELDKADEHLRIALGLRPNAYEPLANRGIVLVRRGNHVEGERFLRDALKQQSDSAVINFYLGHSLLGQKRFDDAELVFRRAFDLGGLEMLEARRALASIYLQRGENEKALTEIEAYLEGNPKAADAGQLRKTADEIKEWLKTSPKPPGK